jgi:type II secretory pathway pseudopilin PulG
MKGSGTKTGLFLIELILCLLMFAFCAAICIQIFQGASRQTRGSEELSRAVFLSTSAAEVYKASDGDLNKVAQALSGSVDGDSLYVSYGADWSVLPDTASVSPAYFLSVDDAGGGTANISVYSAKINSRSNSNEIFALTVKVVSGNA